MTTEKMTPIADPSQGTTPTADGTMEERDGVQTLRYRRQLAHPVARVWAALTEPAELRGWLGAVETELRLGGRYTIRWLNTHEGETTIMPATITALDPPHLLEIVGEPHGRLRWELAEGESGTLLSFSSTVALPAAYRASVLAGWHYHLDALATALDGGTTELVALPNAAWQAHHDRYAARLA